jgi:hypothetical protein
MSLVKAKFVFFTWFSHIIQGQWTRVESSGISELKRHNWEYRENKASKVIDNHRDERTAQRENTRNLECVWDTQIWVFWLSKVALNSLLTLDTFIKVRNLPRLYEEVPNRL